MPDTGRRVEFEGAVNFRDVGGLRLSGSDVVRRGVLYRSDSLHGLTPADLDRLHDELGVRAVLDLRMDEERAQHGPSDGHFRGDVEVVHRPLFTAMQPHWAEAESWQTEEQRAERYLEFLECGPDVVVEIVRDIGARGRTPAVVHCHSGRDRTGIVVALLLELLGVDRAVIGDDYAVTSRYITDWELSPQRMTLLLGLVDRRYGSVDALLREHGMTDADLAAFRAALVD